MNERGSVTVFLAVAAVGLLALVGLVVDGAAKVRAVQRADRLAAEAARAAGQAVDLTGVLAGEAIRVDRRAALVAAGDYLRAAGAEGSAHVSSDGRTVTVTTHATQPTVFLGLIGMGEFAVRGRAEVDLVHSQGGVTP
jgi:hypothetical protein